MSQTLARASSTPFPPHGIGIARLHRIPFVLVHLLDYDYDYDFEATICSIGLRSRVGRDLRARRIRAVTPPASARLSCATNGQSPGITHATRLAGRVTPKSQTKAERLRPTLPAVKTMTVILKFFPDYGHGEGRRPRRPRRAARPRPLPGIPRLRPLPSLPSHSSRLLNFSGASGICV